MLASYYFTLTHAAVAIVTCLVTWQVVWTVSVVRRRTFSMTSALVLLSGYAILFTLFGPFIRAALRHFGIF